MYAWCLSIIKCAMGSHLVHIVNADCLPMSQRMRANIDEWAVLRWVGVFDEICFILLNPHKWRICTKLLSKTYSNNKHADN